MNNKDYKKALDQIEPDDSLREKVWQGLGNKSSFFSGIRLSTIALATVFILSIVSFNALLSSGIEKSEMKLSKSLKMDKKIESDEFIGFDSTKSEIKKSESMQDSNSNSTNDVNAGSALKANGYSGLGNKVAADSVGSNAYSDMSKYLTRSIGSFDFDGRAYKEDNDNYLSEDQIDKLKGEKLGTTKIIFLKGSLENESFKDDPFHPNKKDLKAYLNGYEVYSVKGYNPDYRVMIAGELNGEKWGSIYNCFTGKYISTGDDVFGNLYLNGNIKLARWKSIDSWRNKQEVFKNIELSTSFENFINALYIAKPISADVLLSDSDFVKCKILYLKMKNQVVEQIWIYPDSKIVKYEGAYEYFKVDDNQFDTFFKTLN